MLINPKDIIVVIDAHCSACANGARWIAGNDKGFEFRIVPLQSQLGRHLMIQHDIDPDDPASWLLLYEGKAFGGVEAWFFVSERLDVMKNAARALRLVPKPIRDLGYRFVARNRRRLFAADDLCALPGPDVARRLVQ